MSAPLKRVDFLDQRERVDHSAIADDAGFVFVQGTGRDQAENIFFTVDHQRMSGIVATLKTYDHVGIGGEEVDDLALALVTPLRADNCNCLHTACPESIEPCTRRSALDAGGRQALLRRRRA